MADSRLILVNHTAPEISPAVPPNRWVLSDEGRRRCEWLAESLAAQAVTQVYSSIEPKALETAALVAVRLKLSLESRPIFMRPIGVDWVLSVMRYYAPGYEDF
jgi:broad specificity phosphatase PhoE